MAYELFRRVLRHPKKNVQRRAATLTLRLRASGMDMLLLPLRSRGACAAGRRGSRLPPPPTTLVPASPSAEYLPISGLRRGGSETELRFGKERCGQQQSGRYRAAVSSCHQGDGGHRVVLQQGDVAKGPPETPRPAPPTCVITPCRVWGTAIATSGAGAGLRPASSTRPCGRSLRTSTAFTAANAHHGARLLLLRARLGYARPQRRRRAPQVRAALLRQGPKLLEELRVAQLAVPCTIALCKDDVGADDAERTCNDQTRYP